MPLISIIIPLYNKEKHIAHTIESVLNQHIADFELIIINDGSTDNSLHVVESIKDNRIRVISQTNSGVSAARNRGIKESKGEYVFLLDADDRLLPDSFNLLLDCENADIVVGSFNQVNQEGIVTRKIHNRTNGIIKSPYKEYCKKTVNLRIGNFFIKRNFLENKGGLRTEMTLYEDEEWILRLIDKAIVYSSKKVILEYIRVPGGLSSGFKPIEREWASIATVKNINNPYKRQILGDFIFRRFVVRWRSKDWHGVKVIWNNNSWRMLYCFYSFIRRSLRGGFIKYYIKDHC